LPRGVTLETMGQTSGKNVPTDAPGQTHRLRSGTPAGVRPPSRNPAGADLSAPPAYYESSDDQPWVQALAIRKKKAEMRSLEIEKQRECIKERVFDSLYHSEWKWVQNGIVCDDIEVIVYLDGNMVRDPELSTYIKNILDSHFDALGYISDFYSVRQHYALGLNDKAHLSITYLFDWGKMGKVHQESIKSS
jgi:hypothetical protein